MGNEKTTGPEAKRPQNRHLIPLSERSPEERAAIIEKGHKAARESLMTGVRRKTAAELMRLFCDVQLTDKRVIKRFDGYGIPADDLNNLTVMVVAIGQKAQMGDVTAFEKVLDLLGEKGVSAEKRENNLLEALYGLVDITKGLINSDALSELQPEAKSDADVVDETGDAGV